MKIIPSPGLVISSDLTVKEAIKIMSDNHSSYLLLEGNDGNISGIFTETDFVRLMGGRWDQSETGQRPIHQFMSSPVRTLSVELMHTAPEFMIRYNVSHVPIKDYSAEAKKSVIVGIITSKSLFEYVVRLRDLPPLFGGNLTRKHRKTIGILSADGTLLKTMNSIFAHSVYVDVERFRFSQFNLEQVTEKISALLIDLDETETRLWLPITKDVVKLSCLGNVFILYSKSKHKDAEKFLAALEVSGLVQLYRKPLNLSKLITDLETLWIDSD